MNKKNHATANSEIMEPPHPGGEKNMKDRQKTNGRLINKYKLC